MTNNPSGLKKLVAKTVDLQIGSVVKKLNSIANSLESKINNSDRINKVPNKISKDLSNHLLPPHMGNFRLPYGYNRWSINPISRRGERGGSRKLKNMRKNRKTRRHSRK